MGERLAASLDDLEVATAHLLGRLETGKTAEALAGATPYLRLFGLAAGGALSRQGRARLDSTTQRRAEDARIATARFMAEQLLPETAALKLAVIDGAEAVLALDAAMLEDEL